jgi:hypothetical protein
MVVVTPQHLPLELVMSIVHPGRVDQTERGVLAEPAAAVEVACQLVQLVVLPEEMIFAEQDRW